MDKCPSGTIVIWEKIDRIIPGEYVGDEEYQRAFLNYAQSVKERISVVFSSYMSGPHKVAFEMNGREISMWDPFMTDNPLTTRMPTEYLYVNGNEVKIKTFILPHQKKLSSNEFSLYAGAHGWNAQQGFRFLYKGIIITHNKTEPTYTKTSLFLCEKRRFFMARTEKGVVATI